MLMRDDEARECPVNKLRVDRLVQLEADGAQRRSKSWRPRIPRRCSEFLVDLKNARTHGLRLTVDVSFYDPAYDLEYIGEVADVS